MKVILITGLDGSGKSTLLKRIRNVDHILDYQIINLPVIHLDLIKTNNELYKTGKFINELNHRSDVLEIPQLKAVALFASMLLYQKILSIVEQTGCKTVYCERHPLIDTGIYAQFYAGKLKPGSIERAILSELDKKYQKELNYLLNLLPASIIARKESLTSTFIDFIYRWFYLDKKYDMDSLKKVFVVDFPDKIYYLQASPKVLFDRIKDRKVLEAHESEQVFSYLNDAYQLLFSKLDKDFVKLIDATSDKDIDGLFAKLIKGKSV